MSSSVKHRYDASNRRQAAARTREAILDSTLELFTGRGYAATPMTAIAERAGVAGHRVRVRRSQTRAGPPARGTGGADAGVNVHQTGDNDGTADPRT